MLGDWCSNQVSVICNGVVFSFVVILFRVFDWIGLNFFRGKNGM